TSAPSVPFAVTAGAAARLAFQAQPPGLVAGANPASAVSVTTIDGFGNPVTGAAGTVRLAIASNPGGGTLRGPPVASLVQGVATFAAFSIDRAGAGYTLQASASGLAPATSARFDVVAGQAAALAFVTAPSSVEVRSLISPPVRVA